MVYLTRAALFFQVGETGRVIGIDHIKELVDWSIANVQKDHGYLLESGQVKLVSEYTKRNGFNVKSLQNLAFKLCEENNVVDFS